MSDHDSNARSNVGILTGTRAWSATPHAYSSMRFLTFKADGCGEAIYGYGQTIYAKVGFEFELSEGSVLRLSYVSSPAYAALLGFEPSSDNAEKATPYTLERGEFCGVESVVAQPYSYRWLLTLGDSPWPTGMTFPYEVPTSFYGFRHDETHETI